jgi:peptidoglycan hydrolase-like protein with peptidoglycan-binding domain
MEVIVMRLVPVSGLGLVLLALLLLPAILTTNVSAAELKSSSPDGKVTPRTIRQAQEALKNKGRDPGPIDGVLGPRTVAALDAYQKAEGLATTGRLDAKTMASLGIQVLPEPRLRADHVQELQQALADRGYDPGPVDGVMGTRTRAALRKYAAVPPPQAPTPADETIKRFRTNERRQSP